ncbi:MAG: ATP-binding protein [Bacteroides sp.]|nr:ATP-binding protein [Bacteroides sp.]MBQ8875795.1 ATP-binding protein [Bacteroides sp.]
MENPFKFGTLVDNEYFTDRVMEQQHISSMLDSPNHIVLISPRRFGKSSLVKRVVKKSGRPFISLNMQQVTCVEDLAAMILKGVFKLHPWEKLKHLLANFRVIPTISTTPLGDSVEIGFQPSANLSALLEDALSLVERVSDPEHRMIVVFDEFQEIIEVEKGIDRKLRAIMQEQQNVNYIFLGSEESMMTDIFEQKKSPFYHFGMLMRLKKIPYNDFHAYIMERLEPVIPSGAHRIAEEILAFTQCHPYYTQQLASMVWETAVYRKMPVDNLIESAVNQITETHDLNFERIWMSLNNTDKRIIRMLSKGEKPYEQKSLPTSTTYSSIKKLMKKGFLIKEDGYEVEDPFFKQWIVLQSGSSL